MDCVSCRSVSEVGRDLSPSRSYYRLDGSETIAFMAGSTWSKENRWEKIPLRYHGRSNTSASTRKGFEDPDDHFIVVHVFERIKYRPT